MWKRRGISDLLLGIVVMAKRKSRTNKSVAAKKPAPRKLRAPLRPISRADITQSVYFREAAAQAESYAKDPERLRSLFEQAKEKILGMPRGPFSDVWAYLMAMIRLVRAYYTGEYREIPWRSLTIIIGAMIYFVSPLDVIPDWIPVLGYVDDALIVGLAVKSVKDDLDAFMEWETETQD